MRLMQRLERWWITLPVLTLLLLLPTLAQQRPFVFWDTQHYYDYGAELIDSLAGLLSPPPSSPAPNANSSLPGTDGSNADGTRSPPSFKENLLLEGKATASGVTFYGARSPFYSVWLYGTSRLFGLWGVVITQALAIAWLIWRAASYIAPARRFAVAFGITAIVTAGSGAWFAVGFAMPDAYAGIGLLSIALLSVFADRMSLVERLALAGLIAASAAFHGTHLVTAVAVGALAALLLLRGGQTIVTRRALLAIGGALVITLAAQLSFDAAVRAVLGMSPKRPPFLMARVIEDGPGRRYLDEICPKTQLFAVCAYRDRPFRNANEFIWDSKVGVYLAIPFEKRLELIEEELRFVGAVIKQYPLSVAYAAIGNVLEQFFLFAPLEAWIDAGSAFNAPTFRDSELVKTTPFLKSCIAQPGTCIPTVPAALIDVIVTLTSLVSLAVIVTHLIFRAHFSSSRNDNDPNYDRVITFSILILFGLIFNAALCGAVSGPYYRYQARVVWLAVVAAFMLEFARPLVTQHVRRRRAKALSRSPSR